jgi:hypothetical protein
MSERTVTPTPGLFPDGTAVHAALKTAAEVERRQGRVPIPNPKSTGVISGGKVTLKNLTEGLDYILYGVVDELQSVKVDATAGQFKLTFETKQTANIAFNATAAQVREALEALESVGAGNCEVTGGPGNSGGTTPYVVKFLGTALAGVNVGAMTAANGTTPLSGGGAAATVTTTTQGSKAGEGGIQRYELFTA